MSPTQAHRREGSFRDQAITRAAGFLSNNIFCCGAALSSVLSPLPPRSAPGSDLPTHYLLVQRPDAVRITHILVFVDERSPASASAAHLCGSTGGGGQGGGGGVPHHGPPALAAAQRMDWLTVIVIAYAALMLLQYASRYHRQLGRWLGLG